MIGETNVTQMTDNGDRFIDSYLYKLTYFYTCNLYGVPETITWYFITTQ